MTGVLGPARQRRLSFFVLIKDVFLRAADCLLWVSRWVTPIFRWVGGGFLPFSGGLTVGFRFWGIFWKISGLWIFQAEKPHCARRIHRRCGESTVAAENPQPLRRIHKRSGKTTASSENPQRARRIHRRCGESTTCGRKSIRRVENPQTCQRIHNLTGETTTRPENHRMPGESTIVAENPQPPRKIHNRNRKSTINKKALPFRHRPFSPVFAGTKL